MSIKHYLSACAFIAMTGSMCATTANANDYSFTGNLATSNSVQLFSFTVGATSDVTLRTWSYAGGVNAAGATISRGGFDPILALFNSAGVLIEQNDDGGNAHVGADTYTSRFFDTFINTLLNPGIYQVAVMQFDNFANGPNLSNGFRYDSNPNFLSGTCENGTFCDVSGVTPYNNRDSHWAFDILNVNNAAVISTPGPIAGAGLPALLGFLGFGLYRRRQQAA